MSPAAASSAEPPAPSDAKAPAPQPPAPDPALEAWNAAKDTDSVAVLEAFIVKFGDSFYAELAKAKLDEVKKKQGETQVALGILPKPETAPEHKPGETFKDCENCPEMVVVPAGEFTMGSPPNEKDRNDNEGPQHSVQIPAAFAVGKFEVTKDQFDAFVNDSGHDAGSKCWTYENWRSQLGLGPLSYSASRFFSISAMPAMNLSLSKTTPSSPGWSDRKVPVEST